MVMNSIRILFAVLYSIAFVLSLSRCSPSVSSIDRAMLKELPRQGNGGSGGINVDANVSFHQPALKTQFVESRQFRKLSRESNGPGEIRVSLSTHDGSEGNLYEFKETGSAEFTLGNSAKLYPAEVWVHLKSADPVNTESCALEVQSLGENAWRVGLRGSSECSARSAILERIEDLTISFRSNDAFQLLDKTVAPVAR